MPPGVRFTPATKDFGPQWRISDVITPTGILDYHHLYQPDQKGRTKFSRDDYDARLLFPKTDPKFDLMKKAFQTIKSLAFADMLANPNWKCRSFVRDGDAVPLPARPGFAEPKKLPEYYKGNYYITVRAPGPRPASGTRGPYAGRPPKMVGRDKKDIPEAEGAALFYRGAQVRFMLTLVNWSMVADDGSGVMRDGVTAKLDVVQWVKHGTPLGGPNVNALDELPEGEMDDGGGAADPLDSPAGNVVTRGAGVPRNALEAAQLKQQSRNQEEELNLMLKRAPEIDLMG